MHSQPDDVYSGDFASANKVEQHLGLHNQANQFIDDYDDSEFWEEKNINWLFKQINQR